MQTLTPLVAKSKEGTYESSLEPVEHCNLLISVSPATGIVEYTEAQGRPVKEVRAQHRGWVSLALLLLSPFIAYALWWLYCVLHERYVTYQHVQWLTNFYLKHAPEVSLHTDLAVLLLLIVLFWFAQSDHSVFVMLLNSQKLKDPQYVDRTLRKYKDKMFLLWRGLEKTYKVRVAPPFSIVDSAAGGIEL